MYIIVTSLVQSTWILIRNVFYWLTKALQKYHPRYNEPTQKKRENQINFFFKKKQQQQIDYWLATHLSNNNNNNKVKFIRKPIFSNSINWWINAIFVTELVWSVRASLAPFHSCCNLYQLSLSLSLCLFAFLCCAPVIQFIFPRMQNLVCIHFWADVCINSHRNWHHIEMKRK